MTQQQSLETERRDHTIKALAGLIAHLHVPRSMGSIMVPKEYDEVRGLIGDFGWSDTEEIERKLRHVLDV